MEQQSFLREAVDMLESSSDLLAAARDLVTRNGGHWNDELAQDDCLLFEIHLFGIAGVGLGAEGAARNWLENARAEIKAPVETS